MPTAHIVLAHPEPQSYSAHLARTAQGALQAAGYEVTLSDLYTLGFDPVEGPLHFSARKHRERFDPSTEQRNAFDQDRLPKFVKEELARLDAADVVMLQFPLWWYGSPAISAKNLKSSYSNYGSWLEMVAPGSSIQSAWCCSANYANASGTSMASPHVAAVAALLLAVDPTLTHNEMWGILQGSAVDLGSSGFDNFYGWGRVNADDAVATAVAGSGNTATPTITPSPTPSPTPTPITVILNPVADAYVDAGSPNTNFGLLPKLLTNSGTVRNGYPLLNPSGVKRKNRRDRRSRVVLTSSNRGKSTKHANRRSLPFQPFATIGPRVVSRRRKVLNWNGIMGTRLALERESRRSSTCWTRSPRS